MNDVDLITMIGNLSQSMEAINHLIGGLSYLVGIVLVYSGLLKLKKVASAGARSQEHHFAGFALIFGGAALLFLPTTLRVLSNTTFGAHNILGYTNQNPWNIFESIGVLIQAAGLIWFVRGCIMVVHASKPGQQEGPRGFLFIFAGILAMNFTLAESAITYIIHQVVGLSFTFKK